MIDYDTKKFKIWHITKHDEYGVSDVEYPGGVRKFIKVLLKDGGFWTPQGFVPWHRVNYIELPHG